MNTYVINRSDRPERLAHVREQLQAQGLNAHRFEAVIASPGWKGCRDSHLQIMEKCKKDVMFTIYEDDILFLERYNDIVPLAIEELPPNWDCLFLGCSPQEPFERYSPHLFMMGKSFCTQAIIWHTRENGAVDYILGNRAKIGKIDIFLSQEVFPWFNCFCIYPMVVTQTQFKSDTCTRSDVKTIERNFKLYCK